MEYLTDLNLIFTISALSCYNVFLTTQSFNYQGMIETLKKGNFAAQNNFVELI